MRVSRLLTRLLILALLVAGYPFLWLRYQQRQRDRALDIALKRGNLAKAERLVLKGVTLAGHPQRARAVLVLAADRLAGPTFLAAYLREGGRLPSLDDRDWIRRPGEAEITDWLRNHPAIGFAGPLSQSIPSLTASLEMVPTVSRGASFYRLLGLCRYQAADYSGATAAFDKALHQQPASSEIQYNLETSRDASRIARAITPQLEQELQRYARAHPEELSTDAPPDDAPPVHRATRPDLGILYIRRLSPFQVVVLSGGVMPCGDSRQDVTHLPNLRVSLWAEERGALTRLWKSPTFKEMVSRDDDSNPEKIVDLRVVDLDGDGVPEVVLTLIARSRYVGTNYATSSSIYVYRCAKAKLRLAGNVTGESRFNDPDWPWLADLRGDGRMELGVAREAGLVITAPVPWTDILALKNGPLQTVDDEFPQWFQEPYEALKAKVADTPDDDEALLYLGKAEEIMGRPGDAVHSYRKASKCIEKELADDKEVRMHSYYRQKLARVNRLLTALLKAHPELPKIEALEVSRRH